MSYKLPRRRDGQQWILDYLAKTAGMVQNFEDDKFELPRGVKNYKMISKLKGEEAAHQEAVARAAEEAGRRETALEIYVKAAESYRHGQHVIFEDDHPELFDRREDTRVGTRRAKRLVGQEKAKVAPSDRGGQVRHTLDTLQVFLYARHALLGVEDVCSLGKVEFDEENYQV